MEMRLEEKSKTSKLEKDLKKLVSSVRKVGVQANPESLKKNYSKKRIPAPRSIFPTQTKNQDSKRYSSTHNDPTQLKKKFISQPPASKLNEMKSELQKLSYREKLIEIESIIKSSQSLSQEYGFFYILPTMLEVSTSSPIKIFLWIHPDIRTNKPLHPISKRNTFESQIQFIVCLKTTLKELFPTIDLGSGKTFLKIILHLNELKNALAARTKKKFPEAKYHSHNESPVKTRGTVEISKLAASMKNVPKLREDGSERKRDENTKAEGGFEKKEFQKKTKSTLLSSFKSSSSFQEKMRNLTYSACKSNDHKFKRNNSMNKQLKLKKERSSQIIPLDEDRLINFFKIDENKLRNTTLHKSRTEEDGNKVKIGVKGMTDKEKKILKESILRKSKLGRYMTTSVEIENELDGLFDSTELPIDFYKSLGKNKQVQNSLLSNIAEEIENVLF